MARGDLAYGGALHILAQRTKCFVNTSKGGFIPAPRVGRGYYAAEDAGRSDFLTRGSDNRLGMSLEQHLSSLSCQAHQGSITGEMREALRDALGINLCRIVIPTNTKGRVKYTAGLKIAIKRGADLCRDDNISRQSLVCVCPGY